MFIIVGLGNPGKDYTNTRHNIGFMAIDEIAEKHNISVIESKHKALIGKGMVGGQKVILAKPLTFMNLSGESIIQVTNFYKLKPITGTQDRELIVFTASGKENRLHVIQTAGTPFLTVEPTEINIPQAGGTITVQVKSNTSWTLY